mmetsp:Transcript_44241/g.140780  ORF Transcript_44241/g.140780 Transcript_44241/m.140780 type:complete len:457 (+) Transcript_44241:297-1667(+)
MDGAPSSPNASISAADRNDGRCPLLATQLEGDSDRPLKSGFWNTPWWRNSTSSSSASTARCTRSRILRLYTPDGSSQLDAPPAAFSGAVAAIGTSKSKSSSNEADEAALLDRGTLPDRDMLSSEGPGGAGKSCRDDSLTLSRRERNAAPPEAGESPESPGNITPGKAARPEFPALTRRERDAREFASLTRRDLGPSTNDPPPLTRLTRRARAPPAPPAANGGGGTGGISPHRSTRCRVTPAPLWWILSVRRLTLALRQYFRRSTPRCPSRLFERSSSNRVVLVRSPFAMVAAPRSSTPFQLRLRLWLGTSRRRHAPIASAMTRTPFPSWFHPTLSFSIVVDPMSSSPTDSAQAGPRSLPEMSSSTKLTAPSMPACMMARAPALPMRVLLMRRVRRVGTECTRAASAIAPSRPTLLWDRSSCSIGHPRLFWNAEAMPTTSAGLRRLRCRSTILTPTM